MAELVYEENDLLPDMPEDKNVIKPTEHTAKNIESMEITPLCNIKSEDRIKGSIGIGKALEIAWDIDTANGSAKISLIVLGETVRTVVLDRHHLSNTLAVNLIAVKASITVSIDWSRKVLHAEGKVCYNKF